jgi:hypothetical protein
MGGRSSKDSSSTVTLSISGGVPNFFYFHRKQLTCLHSSSKGVRSLPFPKSFEIAEDSSILHLESSIFLSVGGSISGKYQSKVHLLNAEASSITPKADLPIPSKAGRLFSHSGWIYYVFGEVQSSSIAPVFRFNLESNRWEEVVIRYSSNSTLKDLKTLKNAGCCLMGNKIYFVGGQVEENESLFPNEQIFSLDLMNESFELGVENVKFGLKVSRPSLVASQNYAILAGGKDLKTGRYNKNIFELNVDDDGLKFKKINSIKFELNEDYPPFVNQGYFVFVSFPFVACRTREDKDWNQFRINQVDLKFEKNRKKNKKKAKNEEVEAKNKGHKKRKNKKVVNGDGNVESFSSDISSRSESSSSKKKKHSKGFFLPGLQFLTGGDSSDEKKKVKPKVVAGRQVSSSSSNSHKRKHKRKHKEGHLEAAGVLGFEGKKKS